jgi:iron-sulfur cluster assembly accessory protein
MLKISDAAAEKGKQILTIEGKPDWGLRVYVAGSGCCGPSFGMDINEHPSEGDEVIEKKGLKVFVEKQAGEKLDGMELDFVESGENSGFVLKGKQNPSCGPGCGPSC